MKVSKAEITELFNTCKELGCVRFKDSKGYVVDSGLSVFEKLQELMASKGENPETLTKTAVIKLLRHPDFKGMRFQGIPTKARGSKGAGRRTFAFDLDEDGTTYTEAASVVTEPVRENTPPANPFATQTEQVEEVAETVQESAKPFNVFG